MKTLFTGGCACGAVRYECEARPLSMHNCHCRDCQRITGGAFASVLVVPQSSFRITGALRRHATTRLTGRPNLRGFCTNCGSSVTVGEDSDRDRVGLMAGSLDDPDLFEPAMNIFICDARPWEILDPALPAHEHYKPRG